MSPAHSTLTGKEGALNSKAVVGLKVLRGQVYAMTSKSRLPQGLTRSPSFPFIHILSPAPPSSLFLTGLCYWQASIKYFYW